MRQIEAGKLLWVDRGEPVWSANASEQIDEEITQIVTEVVENCFPAQEQKRARRRSPRR